MFYKKTFKSSIIMKKNVILKKTLKIDFVIRLFNNLIRGDNKKFLESNYGAV